MRHVRQRSRGFSLMELLVALSLIATLSAFVFPVVAKVRRDLYTNRCVAQLQQVGLAIKLYREDYGASPWPLGRLYPDYLPSRELLVCPWVAAMVRNDIIKQQNKLYNERYPWPWSSYFSFSHRGLDDLYQRGETPLSYTGVLKQRRGETPVVICRDHRERFTNFWVHHGIVWDFPAQPVVVLRWDGTVSLTQRGGSHQHHTTVGTMMDALQL